MKYVNLITLMASRIFFKLGLLLLVLIPVWYLVILPPVNSLPVNFSQVADLTHTEDNRFEIGSEWSGKTVSIGSIDDRVIKTENRKAFFESKFHIQSLTGDPLFSLKQKFVVDRQTMKNYPEGTDIRGEAYFLFPRHLQKTTYRWWPNSFGESFDVRFVDLRKIGDLTTYHFRGERSDINDTAGYDFLPQVPEKYLTLSRAELDVFVEPDTGMVIDYRDEGISYYASTDKKPIWDIAQWSNRFNDETIRSRINKAKDLRERLYLTEIFTPLFILVLSLVLILFGVRKNLR